MMSTTERAPAKQSFTSPSSASGELIQCYRSQATFSNRWHLDPILPPPLPPHFLPCSSSFPSFLLFFLPFPPLHLLPPLCSSRGVLVSSSANATDTAVFAHRNDRWEKWELEDTGRVEMPLDQDNEETFAAGMALDLTSQQEVVISEWYTQ